MAASSANAMKRNLIEYDLAIDGMMCGMCEAHVNDLIRRKFPFVKKVKSSVRKNRTVIKTETPIDLDELKAALNATGYIVIGIETVNP